MCIRLLQRLSTRQWQAYRTNSGFSGSSGLFCSSGVSDPTKYTRQIKQTRATSRFPRFARHGLRPFQEFSVYRGKGRHGAFPSTRRENPMRPHLSLDVRNVPASVESYQKVFGVAPQKQTTDYAKFDLTAPALNLALVSST